MANLFPFRCEAMTYHECNLSVFPCSGENGKRPAIRTWKKFQHSRPEVALIQEWMERKAECNIAIVTGPVSGITVVDCDDPRMDLSGLHEKFGPTPYVIETPRGGKHLYYKYNGEASAGNILNLKIDIKATGGYVIAPPSYNPEVGRHYRVIHGSWHDFDELPEVKNCALKNTKCFAIDSEYRNLRLFYYLKEIVSYTDDTKALELAVAFNLKFKTPMEFSETERVWQNVIQYKASGRLFPRGVQHIPVKEELVQLLAEWPKTHVLYFGLLRKHNRSTTPFSISPAAYAPHLHMSPKTMRAAINRLIKLQVITKVHVGGRWVGDTNLYTWV